MYYIKIIIKKISFIIRLLSCTHFTTLYVFITFYDFFNYPIDGFPLLQKEKSATVWL